MITSVRLRGFRRYEDETLVLGPGLNFVEGDNNAGKTTILYAIEYALFGRVDGFKNQGAFVAPNAKGMGVELVFVGRDGERYRLQRAHLRPPRSKTKLEGHFTLKRLGATAEDPEAYVLSSDFQDREEHLALKLQALTGLTRRLFGIAVHMRQGEIARILEGAPELDIVLGVTAAVVADDELRAIALESEKKAAALPVAVETARRVVIERTSLNERREAAEANIAELRADFAAIEGELSEVRDALAAQRSEEGRLKVISAADDAARDAKRRLEDHHERAVSIRAKGGRDEVSGRLAAIELRQQTIDDERVRVRKELAAADEERRELDRQRGDLAGRIQRRERLPSGEGATCETCGAAIDTAHHASEMATWRGELAAIDARLGLIASATTLSQAASRAFDKEERELAVTRAEGTRQLSDLAELESVGAKLEGVASAASAAFIGAANAGDIDGARVVRAELATRVAELARTNIERSARVEAERRSLSTRVNQAESDVANLGSKIAELDRELAAANATIAELQTHARKAERLRKLAAAFKELQLSLRADASASLAASAHTLHAALGTLDGVVPEFDKVTVDPTRYSVQVVPKHLGEEVPAALYEGGGHRLLLGLAMKLAVSKLIGRVPFVMLDEPTYGLDGAHRTQLLERIAGLDVADQIVLITHDVDLQSVGINRVRVVRDGDHSRIRAGGGA